MSDKSMMDSILSDFESHGSEWDEAGVRSLIERAFEAGKADQSDPLAGYSNLTDARKNGQPIDWDKLDGLSVRIFNPDISIVRGKMARNKYQPRDKETGWWTYGVHEDVYTLAFIQGWKGLGGWSLWVKGEIPMVKKTADQLKVGMGFRGKNKDVVKDCIVYEGMKGEPKMVAPLPDYKGTVDESTDPAPTLWLARDVEVLDEYGMGSLVKPSKGH